MFNPVFATTNIPSKSAFDTCFFTLNIGKKDSRGKYPVTGGVREFSLPELQHLRQQFPHLKLGVLSYAPVPLTELALRFFYPDFSWDRILYETDTTTSAVVPTFFSKSAIVGTDADSIKTAYRFGSFSIVFDPLLASGNLRYFHRQQWDSNNLFPDAVIQSFATLSKLLSTPSDGLPYLEKLLNCSNEDVSPRILCTNKFAPTASPEQGHFVRVFSLGRYFSTNSSFDTKRKFHPLSKSIIDHKSSHIFPNEWLQAATVAISDLTQIAPFSNILVCTIPARPGRPDRMNDFLTQLKPRLLADHRIQVADNLLAFHEGVLSNHGDRLNKQERFENIQKFLFVSDKAPLSNHPIVIVLDDIATSGATFFWADRYLRAAGASNVLSIALAFNIGEIKS